MMCVSLDPRKEAMLEANPVVVSHQAPVVEVHGARKTFEAEFAPVRALRGVDLSVESGEFVAITGPSGCGKSTLLNVIAGLETADEGTVEVAGLTISGLDAAGRARMRQTHIGFVFQFFNLLDELNALENVAIASLIAGNKRKLAEARARELLGLLGLSDKASQFPTTLSGGQRQRLALARALTNRPTVLLADEPTGALDSAGGAEIVELLRRLNADGQTILLVTHSDELASAATRVVTMRDGAVMP